MALNRSIFLPRNVLMPKDSLYRFIKTFYNRCSNNFDVSFSTSHSWPLRTWCFFLLQISYLISEFAASLLNVKSGNFSLNSLWIVTELFMFPPKFMRVNALLNKLIRRCKTLRIKFDNEKLTKMDVGKITIICSADDITVIFTAVNSLFLGITGGCTTRV